MNKNLQCLDGQNVLNPIEIRQDIIENHTEHDPIIWKVLLEAVGLRINNLEKENTYNDIEYKLLFKYSFVEYLANHTLRNNSQDSTLKEIDIPTYHSIIMDKVERDKLIDLYSNCSESYENLYGNSVSKDSLVDIDLVNGYKFVNNLKEVLMNSLEQNEVEKKSVRLVYRHPLKINNKILHQIHIDIKRLSPECLKVGEIDVSFMYYNILVLVSHRRPTLGYIQGMADILVPFVVEFSRENIRTAESSSYFCYLKLLDRIQKT